MRVHGPLPVLLLLLACETTETETGAPDADDTAVDTVDTGGDSPADSTIETGATGGWVPVACPEDTSTAPACPEGPDGDGDGWTDESAPSRTSTTTGRST